MTTTGSSSASEVHRTLVAQARRREIATLGAYSMHSQYDGKAVAARSMDSRMKRYREQVDPSGELARRNPQELARRAQAALNADMARVRLAKRERAAVQARLHTMIQRTPSDDLPMLGAELVALELNAQASQRIAVDEAALQSLISAQSTAQTEAASVSAEAASAPKSRRNTQIIVSSDGGPASIAPTRRRRQTSTPKTTIPQPKMATSKKAAKQHGSSSKQR